MTHKIDSAAFLKDVSAHQMHVVADNNLHRHLRFRRPGSSIYWFEIVTWPGSLCINGDMGSFVFSRVDDMFDFFRADSELEIDPKYWLSKLVAVDGVKTGSAVEFDADHFVSVIDHIRKEWIVEAARSGDLDRHQRRELWDAVDTQILTCISPDEQDMLSLAYEFEWYVYNGDDRLSYYFRDLHGYNFTRPSFHFLWCCYAIQWGILQYDTHCRNAATNEQLTEYKNP